MQPIRIHHLDHSQSQRIVWLCEELELPYELTLYKRDPITRLAPPPLLALHPLGAAPVIEDGDVMLAESGAIVDYLIHKHGDGRLAYSPTHPDYAAYLYWFHFANGTLQPAMLRLLMVNRVAPGDGPSQRRVDLIIRLIDDRLASNAYLAGRELTAADIMSVFSLTTMLEFQPVQLTPNIHAYLDRVAARPAYRRAMAAG